MPRMHASYQKERRERIKREKLERKRVYREKVAEGRKKIKETAEVAEPMLVDDNEEENEIVMLILKIYRVHPTESDSI